MIHPATGTNLYLSGPDLPPWDERKWHYFERTEVIEKLKEILLDDKTAIRQVSLIGPYKIGKTSTINYLIHILHRDKHWKIIPVRQTDILHETVKWSKQYIENMMARPNSDNQIWMRFWKLVNDMPGDWWDQWDRLTGSIPEDDQRRLLDDLRRAIKAAKERDIQDWLRHFRRCLQKDTTNVMLVFLGNSELTLISDQFQNENLGNNIVQVRILCEGRAGYEGLGEETAPVRPGPSSFEVQRSPSEIKSSSQVRKIEIHAFTREEAKRFVMGDRIDPHFAGVTFSNIDEILDQVGYHPALLQIVCWWMVDDKDLSGCWDRRLQEISAHVSELIEDEEEKKAILDPQRGISPSVFNRLRGKGVVL